MEPNQQQSAPTMPPQEPMKEEKGVGGIIGIIIIVIILIVAGVYLYANRPDQPLTPPTPPGTVPGETAPSSETLRVQGSSDNLGDIEADLNSTNFDNMDGELNDMQTEVNAAQ
jgi:hypothetical protein